MGHREKQNTIQMAPGDRVYLFSDGLIEAFNESGEPFGLDRLRITLEGLRGKPLEETVPAVFDVVVKWGNNAPFEDDVSMIAFEAL